MNPELIRRRGMMAGVRVAYAITRESNPEQMAVCYSKGWAASPDHMTVEEANSLYVSQTQLGQAFTGISRVDLREFTNFYYDNTWGFLYGYGYTTDLMLTLPNKPFTQHAKGVNLNTSGNKFIVIPAGVTQYNQNTVFYNQGLATNRNCIVHFVLEGETPPQITGNWVNNEPLHVANNATIAAIYVPDAAVEAYKQTRGWSHYADIIHPLSEYSV